MAQTGYTPIQLYYSSTTTNAPLAANLAYGELAINITDGKLFYKDNANAIQVIGWKVVPATAGGTGQTSYAVGDLLYANTTTTIAKLADVATGNALISGGVGVAPSYGKIGLTTHVSGTLPTANGGTNLTSFTANGVVYASSTSALTTGSALVFDGTNFVIGASSQIGSAVLGVAVNTATSNGFSYKTTTDGAFAAMRALNNAGSEKVNIQFDTTNAFMAIRTNDAEAARFNSGKNLMVATTTVGGTISCPRNGNNYNYYATSDANNTTEGFFLGYSSGAAANRIIIYSNGNVVNANNSYGPLSDIKLKENIVDATPKLDKLMQVRVVNYNLKTDPQLKQIGVIAQELEQIFSGLVDEHSDKDAEGNDLGTTTKSVKMSVFVPILIKAMQEQNQIIEELKNRIIALENKG
jgi:hypothetical protein